MTSFRSPKLFWATLVLGLAAGGQALAQSDEGNQLVAKSSLGAWVLRDDPATPRLNCAVTFLPARVKQPVFTILGPTPKASSSVILFTGSDIPAAPTPQDVQLDLVQQGLATTRLRAVQLPRQGRSADGGLAIATGDIRQTLRSMRDAETNLQLQLEGRTVVQLDYDGMAAARQALLDCVDGKRFAGQSLRDATAEIRPLGDAVIQGQAWYKPAALASKRYPPKGSQAVGLIWMTDEFKAWYEQVKRDGKAPTHIPLNIARHFMRARVLDDQGSFAFTNMPAGEYLLVADFSYERTVNREEVIGRTDIYVGGNHVGSNPRITVGTYAFRQGVTFEKRVVVQPGQKTVDVQLEKSQLGCFLVCF